MSKSGLPVPVAALLSGVLASGAAAQETARDPMRLPPSAVVAATDALRAGNPLWAIPLGELSETQARPLFSPSRRPPALPVVAAVATPPPVPATPPRREPDHPRLTLLGTIVSEAVEIGVFVDETSQDMIRLKAGEVHDGWTLSSVVGRAAFFQKEGYRAATLSLPPPAAEAAQPIATGGNSQVTAVPPGTASAPPLSPETTKGESKRPPREG
jgi:general secretion pathway protein N